MARAFFDQVADALLGFLPPDLRDEASYRASGGNLKIWFEPATREHYEVQVIGRAALKAGGIAGRAPALEIGFHAEHADAARNDAVVERLLMRERTWRRRLGPDPVDGPFVGRPSPWKRISELWHGDGLDTDEAAIEAAERLAAYVVTFEEIRRA